MGPWKKWRPWFFYILLLPPLISFVLFPQHPAAKYVFIFISFWVVPYFLLGNFLIFYTYYKTENRLFKKNMIIVSILFFFLTIPPLATNYILKLVNINDAWKYNTLILIAIVLFFLFIITQMGLFGVKLRLRNRRLENTIKAAASGTSLLKHAIKNDAVKISMIANTVKHCKSWSREEINMKMDSIVEITNFMIDFANKISKKINALEIQETYNDISSIIDEAVIITAPSLEKKSITLKKLYYNDSTILCDKLYTVEAIINIINNAIDASDSGSSIYVMVYSDKRTLTIEIKDNGCGIARENLPYVLDPFFTTKNNPTNYGLGLSYCYNIVKKQNGNLRIKSKIGSGTSVFIDFPIKKALYKVPTLIKSDVV
jgi:signal transduction histidine kinase